MQWCVAGLITGALALIAGVVYRSPVMLIDAVGLGTISGLLAWFGWRRGWFEPWQ